MIDLKPIREALEAIYSEYEKQGMTTFPIPSQAKRALSHLSAIEQAPKHTSAFGEAHQFEKAQGDRVREEPEAFTKARDEVLDGWSKYEHPPKQPDRVSLREIMTSVSRSEGTGGNAVFCAGPIERIARAVLGSLKQQGVEIDYE